MSIKTRLILVVVVISLLFGSFLGFFIYWQNNKKIVEHIEIDVKKTVNFSSQLVNLYLGGVEKNLANLAIDPVIISALETKTPANLALASEKMTIIRQFAGSIENIGLHEVKNSSCVIVSGDKDALSIVGTDFTNRDYCQGILKTKKSYLSSSFVSVISKKPVLAFAVPVRNHKEEMLGYVLGTIILSDLRGYLWDLQDNSKVELLDRYGTMFLNTEENIEKLGDLSETEKIEINKIQENKKNKIDGVIRDEDDFIGFKFGGSLTVIFEKSAGDLLDFNKILNLTLVISLVVAIVLMIMAIFFFVGVITKRISRLSKITQDISSGKFEIKLDESDFKAKDETAVLARSFNEMAGKLDHIYKDLEDKVKQRTKEVEEKNKKLIKSEEELKKTLELSEKTNKMMVGRELEMVKLKQKIKESEKSL